MYNFVATKRAGLTESFATDLAYKRSSTRVHRHVARQIIVSIEHLFKKKKKNKNKNKKSRVNILKGLVFT